MSVFWVRRKTGEVELSWIGPERCVFPGGEYMGRPVALVYTWLPNFAPLDGPPSHVGYRIFLANKEFYRLQPDSFFDVAKKVALFERNVAAEGYQGKESEVRAISLVTCPWGPGDRPLSFTISSFSWRPDLLRYNTETIVDLVEDEWGLGRRYKYVSPDENFTVLDPFSGELKIVERKEG